MKQFKPLNIAAIAVIVTILGATAEALYTPLTKLFVTDTGTLMSLAFIFFGAGSGLLIVLLLGRKSKAIYDPERRLQKKDTWKIIGIILLTALANLLLLTGIQQEAAATASILRNVTTVATVLFAVFLLREKISKRLGIGVGLIVLGSIALSITDLTTFSFSTGSLLIIGGCITFGGLYTLLTLLSDRNPIVCSIIRGFGVGVLALILALCFGEALPSLSSAIGLMVAGFIGCGLSTMFLMYGQRHLGSAKAGAIFGIYPLIGVVLAIPLLGEVPSAAFLAALIMFIPGMYFAITKNSGADTAKTGQTEDLPDEDTQFFTSIPESRKSEMRNHTTSFGLLVIAVFFSMMMLGVFESGGTDAAADTLSPYLPAVILGIFLLICGIVLLVLGKRVLVAVTFILMSPHIISFAIEGDLIILSVLSGIFSILFALILLTSKDPQKYAFAAVNFLFGAASISNIFSSTVCGIIMAAATVYLIWLSIACSTRKLRYSISKSLVEDGKMTFGKCGSVIGYLLLANIMLITLIYEFTDLSFFIFSDEVMAFILTYAGCLVLVGLLLLFIGRRRITSYIFIGSGLSLCLDIFSTGLFVYLSIFLLLVLGIQVLCQKNSRILPAFMLIGIAFSTMLFCQLGNSPDVGTAMLILTATCTGIALYLAFAVFSEKPRLPIF